MVQGLDEAAVKVDVDNIVVRCCVAEKFFIKVVLVQLAAMFAYTFHAYQRAKYFEVAEAVFKLIVGVHTNVPAILSTSPKKRENR